LKRPAHEDDGDAAFRWRVLGPLVDPLATDQDKRLWRRTVLKQPFLHPVRGPTQISERTLRRWLAAYRTRQWEGLKTHFRQKTGSKVITEALLGFVETLIAENPLRSTKSIIDTDLRHDPRFKDVAAKVAVSTLNRHLLARGVCRLLHPDKTAKPPFKAFEAPYANALWHSDVHYGPDALDDNGQVIETYIVSWLCDHSRVCCHCQAYTRQDFNALMDAWRKAMDKFGICERTYTDNGGIYSGTQFDLACGDLGVVPYRTAVASPWQNGKQERLWSTAEREFFSELRLLPPVPLKKLNHILTAWVEGTYNIRPHSVTKEAPLDRWAATKPKVRYPTEAQTQRLFWLWERRKVSTTSMVQLYTNTYYVDPALAGRWIVVRYDPNDLGCIHVWSNDRRNRQLLCKATAKQLLVGRREKPDLPKDIQPSSIAALRRLDAIEARYQALLAKQAGFIQFTERNES
jgi:hypothetical protein